MENNQENNSSERILWAPWRMEYIRREKDDREGCMFCRKAESGEDSKNHVIYRGETGFALLNIYPYNNGHVLVAPYRHLADLDQLSEKELFGLLRIVRICLKALRQIMDPQGFNVGFNIGQAAGAGIVDHIHLHVVPRWNGDTNFMPVLGGTDVIPQSLREVYELLRRACGSIAAGNGSSPADSKSQ